MRKLIAAMALAAALAAGAPATGWAQDADVVVVTGTRISSFERDDPPHVRLVRRADAMAMTVSLECDTRDLSGRERELRATLRNLLRTAERDRRFDVGMIVEINDLGDEQVIPFTQDMVEGVNLNAGRRADTSEVTISLVSAIGADDSYAEMVSRFDSFLAQVDLVGRAQFLPGRDINLTVTGGPQRYRGELLAAVAADAIETAGLFGETFTVSVSGLEGAVRWQQAGPLSLTLYLNYELTVQPN